jgi:UDP-N-acetylmuramate: L-alanyl-gamma-D-glutamyl-meso-diaminopimelate ligase
MMNLDPLLNHLPQKTVHIHLMGICGTGMAALAGMLQASGYRVSGSDSKVYPPMSDFLRDLGIEVFDGYGGDNLSPSPDLVIVGNVITRKNPEAIALSKTDIAYLSFPQALSTFFITSRTSLVVTGTHGKTTTCALLATTLQRAGLDPTFMIGGILPEFDSNFRLGKGEYFIAEGDEYDSAFFDKESKFLHYRPQIAVITSVEFDHADIFDNLQMIKDAFRKFVALLPEDGLLIANFDDNNVRDVVSDAPCQVQSYGLDSSYHWSFTKGQTSNGTTSFDIYRNGVHWAPMSVKMSGTHNCLNSLAVCAVMNRVGISPGAIEKGLSTFRGVKRRQEVRGVEAGITVIDDFAHHPTAVRETLAALKSGYPEKRLMTVFEPRTNSSRRSIFQQDYVGSFDAADIVLLREPQPLEGYEKQQLFSSTRLAEELLKKKNIVAEAFDDTDQILARLAQLLKKGDLVAILSNGGFDNIHNRLLAQLKER